MELEDFIEISADEKNEFEKERAFSILSNSISSFYIKHNNTSENNTERNLIEIFLSRVTEQCNRIDKILIWKCERYISFSDLSREKHFTYWDFPNIVQKKIDKILIPVYNEQSNLIKAEINNIGLESFI
jgi:hypothetical protein